MSVEAPKPVEETPAVEPTKAVPEQTEAPAAPVEETAVAPLIAPTTEAAPAATEEPAVPAKDDLKKDEVAVAAAPISEGILGYKEPTLLKRFFFSKHYFWFSEEPLTAESLSTVLKSEKDDMKHYSAAWARETGKGLLFFSKRAEDKATPAGIINLADASNVTKEGFSNFSFKAGTHQHRFEATGPKERDSWVVAIEKSIEEAKVLKEDVRERESYKKNIDEYAKPAVVATTAPATTRSKSKEPKKSLDATTATATAPETATTSATSADEVKKENKDRSQSRKRGSIFGSLIGKKEEHDAKKEEKAEHKKEVKEEKKEDANTTEEPSKAVEAGEAAGVAAVPIAASTTEQKTDKEPITPATEKKNKRGSVFGSFYKRVTSPTAEKSEEEASAALNLPPVSETAPKLEEPIENKPIDTAAVTAPVDTVETPAATEPTAEATTTSAATEPATAPKTEKKGGFLGFMKKTEAKQEGKKEHKEETKEAPKETTTEDQAAEIIAKDPVAAASTEATEPVIVAAPTETATETPAVKEERPARENERRSSFFFNKKRTDATETKDGVDSPKREKSPAPGKFIGNLVRRASKAVRSDGSKEKTATEPAATSETTTSETPAVVPEAEETHTKTDAIAEEPVVTSPEPVVPAAREVQATA
ncbi:hypothetical protein LTS07_010950 [Exophiala sideris]|uniref:PH domain-containing protein n=1 Tax=Exophiala sideris TaxID=1016849 RepID=A0ABR0IWA4_9EURO|nr:hypothetical protein LTS07_010950 [Exophiala sideris]KAK5024537.1 hypothetical protein LTR13_010793 [Exophiala sideris]KAK5049678.1 hypothetical protein LTR69_010974 [Exophiala sideris]KAK5176659.1 hypothetical protein LTR44_010841 [Eurotiomycetes sp. CCFEE 6388]